MSTLQSPRGTRDILPEQQHLWHHVKTVAERVATQLGFQPISTPTYEYRTLFERSIGEGTDIMDKELFLVRGRNAEGSEEYALRPEGTAGIVRAFIEHGMQQLPQPVKLYSFVNNFRYDRPQKGRYREHVQLDLELFGETGPFSDAWIILATCLFLKELGLEGVMLHINSLGTTDERKAYEAALVEALTPKISELSCDSQKRLSTNPLRILDSKDAKDQALLDEAPKLEDFFGPESKQHFYEVEHFLMNWKIPFIINPRLVRGLDYYCHTAFEVTTEGAGGQQSSLGGGGRYDGLVTQLGGPSTGAVGVALGLDRVIEEMERQEISVQKPTLNTCAVIATDPESKKIAANLVLKLLYQGKNVIANFDRESMSSQMKAASKQGAVEAYIIGEQERSAHIVTIKDLTTGEQRQESL